MTTMTIEHHVNASIDLAWTAWTTSEGLESWWWPHLPDTTYLIDPHPGGSYRFESATAGIGVEGEFEIIEEPHLLEMTWRWLDDGIAGADERVRVEFHERHDGTTIRVIHHAATDEAAAAYHEGWNDVLGRLT